jgi:asparagine synthase (glutamine-hydrolysing)
MCGITGIISSKRSLLIEPLLAAMTNSIAHRGPDAEGLFLDKKGGVGLGHRRLSIIDLSDSANQPFSDQSGRYTIVFNGEIYNYQDLRKKFDDAELRTQSDTEVILLSYIRWGVHCLQDLNGMFAFAIWDREKESLFVARDRLGIKPLYYTMSEGNFIFCSELKPIIDTGIIEKKINETSISDYFFNQSVSAPYTIIQDIFQLMPGEYGIYNASGLKLDYYWNIASNDKIILEKNYNDVKNKTFQLLMEATERQMIADVPVGAFLSGGIDSSILVALMSEISSKPIETFSITFGEKEYDESQFALNIAKKYKTNHHDIHLSPDEMLGAIPHILSQMNAPNSDGANIYMVSKSTRESGLKVALSGCGADELFCGYHYFGQWSKINRVSRFWKGIRPFRSLISNNVKKSFTAKTFSKLDDLFALNHLDISSVYPILRRVISPSELEEISALPLALNRPTQALRLSENLNRLPSLSQFSAADLSEYTSNVVLNCTDQMSMLHALEVRVPFLDHILVEYIIGLPDRFKIDGKKPKSLLVDAIGDRIPHENIYRKKMGFTLPYDFWLKHQMRAFADDRVRKFASRSFSNEEALISYWSRFLKNDPSITWSRIWSIVVLEEWLSNNGL